MSNAVPDGWTIKSLADVSTFVMGQAPHGSTCNKDGEGTPFVKAGEFSTRYPVIREWTTNPLKMAEYGDVLICVVGATAGKLNLGVDSAIGRSVAAIRPTDTTTLYLYYFMQQHVEKLRDGSSGSAQGVITREHLKDIVAPFPPLPEQQKIAAILASVDDVIEKTQAQIDKLKDLKTGMMQELLTKGIGHTEFKDSPVGRIPVGWDVVPLSEISEKISDGIHTTPKYTDHSEYRFINGNNLVEGRVVFGEKAKYVSHEEYEKHRKDLGDNTILMSINGTIGNLAYYRSEEVVLGKSASYISLKEDQSKKFVYYLLQSEQIKEFYELELTGSTIRNLSLRSIKNTPTPLPSEDEQKKIASIIESIDLNIKVKNQKLLQMGDVKKALMQDLLTGKVRVST